MRWFLLWFVLILAACLVIGLIGRNLWRKTKALTAEVTAASDRLSAVSASLAELSAQQSQRSERPAGLPERDSSKSGRAASAGP
ncbi:MAG: hypothetical protein ACXV4A_01435 [Actinomycetes bacterium]